MTPFPVQTCNYPIREHFYRLAELVEKRAVPGSPIHKAAQQFNAQRHQEGGPGVGVLLLLKQLWNEATESEKLRIFNGWPWVSQRPSMAEFIRMIPDEEIAPMLCAYGDRTGDLIISPEFMPTFGDTSQVRVSILEGTDAATATALLRGIVGALEKHFASAIQMPIDHGAIDVEAGDYLGEGVESAMARAEAAMEQVKASMNALQSPFEGDRRPSLREAILQALNIGSDPRWDEAKITHEVVAMRDDRARAAEFRLQLAEALKKQDATDAEMLAEVAHLARKKRVPVKKRAKQN